MNVGVSVGVNVGGSVDETPTPPLSLYTRAFQEIRGGCWVILLFDDSFDQSRCDALHALTLKLFLFYSS